MTTTEPNARSSATATRECPVCGDSYVVNVRRLEMFGRGTTCSRACSYEARARSMRLPVEVVCSTCGQGMTRSPARIKSKHEGVYCSRACHYAGRSLGYTARIVASPYVRVAEHDPDSSRRAWETRRQNGTDRHSDDTRAKLRDATARAIAEGRVPAVSKIEDVVARILDDLGVDYERQHPVRGAHGRYVGVVDFWLVSERACLEVNGTFWHADPRVFSEPVHPVQKHNALAWRRKMDALAALGLPVACVWELDIDADPRLAVERALDSVAI